MSKLPKLPQVSEMSDEDKETLKAAGKSFVKKAAVAVLITSALAVAVKLTQNRQTSETEETPES